MSFRYIQPEPSSRQSLCSSSAAEPMPNLTLTLCRGIRQENVSPRPAWRSKLATTLPDLTSAQRSRWLGGLALVESLHEARHLSSAFMEVKTDTGWLACNVERQGDLLHWLGPSTLSYQEEPPWDWKLELRIYAPAQLDVLNGTLSGLPDCEAHYPSMLIANGFVRPPVSEGTLDIGIWHRCTCRRKNAGYS